MKYVLRIEKFDVGYEMYHANSVNYEEWDSWDVASKRAITLRKQGARVTIYFAL